MCDECSAHGGISVKCWPSDCSAGFLDQILDQRSVDANSSSHRGRHRNLAHEATLHRGWAVSQHLVCNRYEVLDQLLGGEPDTANGNVDIAVAIVPVLDPTRLELRD